MADTIKTQETGTPQSTSGTSQTPGTTGYTGNRTTGQPGQSATAARQAREQSPAKDREGGYSSFADNLERGAQKGSEMAEHARENFNEAYDRASRSVAHTWEQAVDYGRKNPGTATLIAFGAGVGVGLVLANTMTSRSRTQRILPPVMNALSEIAAELFR